VTPLILGDALEGEAREVGRVMAGIARQVVLRGQPAPPPIVLLSGGETTVTVKGSGRGGRNVEFLLSLAVELGGLPGVFALAGDTDGVDGVEEIAGAIVTPDTLARAVARGISAKARLADNDGHSFFEALGDQVITGPTLTNVNNSAPSSSSKHKKGRPCRPRHRVCRHPQRQDHRPLGPVSL
jgi:glycerate 2-kinase